MGRSEWVLRRRDVLKVGAALAVSGCSGLERVRADGMVAEGPSALTAQVATDSLINDDATALAARVRSGEVTPTELLGVVANRVEQIDGSLNAISTLCFDRARERVSQVRPEQIFAGVPFLLKDMIDCAGVRRTDGAHAIFDRVPTRSPDLIRATESAGLNVVGVTNVPEFASLPTTINPRFGATRNPWDRTRTPAGSSGGSAAAVAAGIVPMAHATDGAGSIRLPASYCGVFGFKPSRARTVSGEANGAHDLVKHHHVISRSVRDSAAFLHLAEDRGPGARYASTGMVRSASVLRRRIRIDRGGIAGLAPDSEVQSALDAAISLLVDLGHEVVDSPGMSMNSEEFWTHLETVFLSRMPFLMSLTEKLTGKAFEEAKVLSPFVRSMARVAQAKSNEDRVRSKAYFSRVEEEWALSLEGVDAVLSPVQPIAPPPFEIYDPNSEWSVELFSIRSFMNYSALANVTGAPAMSVPLYWTSSGLPLGSQLTATPGADRLLFELAFELEEAVPWAGRWAPLSVAYAAESKFRA